MFAVAFAQSSQRMVREMGQPLKVVLIDDELDFCQLVRENLEEGGEYKVITCSEPAQAVSVVKSEMSDLVLIDEVMPIHKGHEIIQALRKDPQTTGIPIIMISGRGEMVYDKRHHGFKWTPNTSLVRDRGNMPDTKSAEKLAVHYGVDDFIAKPFTTDILIEIISGVMSRRGKQTSPGSEEPPV